VVVLFLFFWSPALLSAWIPGAQAEQALGLKLVGTAVTDDPSQNFAIIEHQSTGNQGAYREGDRLGEVLIKKILSGSVVIGTKMGEQILAMGSGTSAGRPPSSGEVAHLDRKEVDSTLADQMQFMREIGVRPRFEGGRPAGFVIYSIEPESIFARMGLEDGDVIVGVNGKSFATTQPTMEFYGALKKGGTVSLEIKREDSKMELHFEIQ
jgi:general secretion pathway protein C